MTLLALLSARARVDGGPPAVGGTTLRALLPLAGQTLVEYQARQVFAAGASECAILVDAVSPELAAAVDRLQRDSIRVSLVRDMPALGRLVAPGDQILMLGEGHMLPTDALSELARQQPPMLLTLPATPETRDFERIDGGGMWAGAALAPGGVLLSTLDMLGEWDLCLTIVRRLVQDGAGRLPCDVGKVIDGTVGIVRDRPGAAEAERVLTGRLGAEQARGDSDDLLFGNAAGMLARVATRRGLAAEQLRITAIICAALCLVSMMLWSVAVGAVLGFGALMLQRVAARVESVLRLIETGRRSDRLPLAIVWAALCLLGWRIGGEGPLAMLGAVAVPVLIAIVPLVAAVAGSRRPPAWALIGPATAVLVLLSGALLSVPAGALALTGLAALCALVWSLRLAVAGRESTGFKSI